MKNAPLCCVPFVVSYYNPRIDYTLKKLVDLVVHKLDRSADDNIGFVVNHYSHTKQAEAERAALNGGKTEQECQQTFRSLIAKLVKGETAIGSMSCSYEWRKQPCSQLLLTTAESQLQSLSHI